MADRDRNWRRRCYGGGRSNWGRGRCRGCRGRRWCSGCHCWRSRSRRGRSQGFSRTWPRRARSVRPRIIIKPTRNRHCRTRSRRSSSRGSRLSRRRYAGNRANQRLGAPNHRRATTLNLVRGRRDRLQVDRSRGQTLARLWSASPHVVLQRAIGACKQVRGLSALFPSVFFRLQLLRELLVATELLLYRV